jgi:predicted CXXCH cytochrome family protein
MPTPRDIRFPLATRALTALKRLGQPGRRRFLVIGAVLTTQLVISCAVSSRRAIVAPPTIAGATFVGATECRQCHQEITGNFHDATHAKLQGTEKGKDISCEACHGPASLHVQSGGASGTILNPSRSPETCFQCHLDKRGEFSLPFSHPVLAGKMSCTDCHNSHQGDTVMGGGTQLASMNETCFKCHTAQRGPFVFEHEALREGCVTCHNPHGSVNDKMLKARNQALCYQCHFQQQAPGQQLLHGGMDHRNLVTRGTCWTAGCHEAIHGSHANSTLRY